MTIRVSQNGAEVTFQPDTAKIRVSQTGAETIFQPNTSKVRVYQCGIEVLMNYSEATATPIFFMHYQRQRK